MHGQRSSGTRVDEPRGASNPTTPPAARAPLLRRGGEIQPNPTTPPAARAPLLRRGGEIQPTRPPRPLRGHPSSGEEGKSLPPRPPKSGQHEHQESSSAAFCLAMSSAIPRFASASSASICAVEKGSPSAVPWISTKPPDPVITTFMSVSQPESST